MVLNPTNIQSHRLKLDSYLPQDRQRFVALVTDNELMRHLDGPLDRARAESLFERFLSKDETVAGWKVQARSDGELIGHAALKLFESGVCEPMIILKQPFWKQGFGTEILRLLIGLALRTDSIDQLRATIDPDHTASRRLAESVGMTLDHWEEDEIGPYPVYQISCQASS